MEITCISEYLSKKLGVTFRKNAAVSHAIHDFYVNTVLKNAQPAVPAEPVTPPAKPVKAKYVPPKVPVRRPGFMFPEYNDKDLKLLGELNKPGVMKLFGEWNKTPERHEDGSPWWTWEEYLQAARDAGLIYELPYDEHRYSRKYKTAPVPTFTLEELLEEDEEFVDGTT